jgi:uncharacterized protein (DUF58 family)
VRWIDWKATLHFGKPIVREFQDARDRCVMLLVDCGRRTRADDLGQSHFDQVLNAVMLLSYVALKQGDEVGAMTFGTPPAAAKSFPPPKAPASSEARRSRTPMRVRKMGGVEFIGTACIYG